VNWALCNGQLLQISQYTALFSLLGTTYGGNGTTNFALPDLRGRVPVSSGRGPGLQDYDLGKQYGSEFVTLRMPDMPAHKHPMNAWAKAGTPGRPGDALLAQAVVDDSHASSGVAGGGQPHENRQPSLVLNWIIALQGIFPSRS
jgi:microcystin-dependent protein